MGESAVSYLNAAFAYQEDVDDAPDNTEKGACYHEGEGNGGFYVRDHIYLPELIFNIIIKLIVIYLKGSKWKLLTNLFYFIRTIQIMKIRRYTYYLFVTIYSLCLK